MSEPSVGDLVLTHDMGDSILGVVLTTEIYDPYTPSAKYCKVIWLSGPRRDSTSIFSYEWVADSKEAIKDLIND
jgi:hypothetical protein